MQRLGFGLALDDTGAGNAGLEVLSQLPVDFVKIDRGIIVKAMTDRTARGVMAGIIAIAKETGAYVIAEGIEDIEMLDFVCGQDWDKLHRRGVQGHLSGRPSATMAAAGDVDDARLILRRGVLRKRVFVVKSKAAGSFAPNAVIADRPITARSAVADRVTSRATDSGPKKRGALNSAPPLAASGSPLRDRCSDPAAVDRTRAAPRRSSR